MKIHEYIPTPSDGNESQFPLLHLTNEELTVFDHMSNIIIRVQEIGQLFQAFKYNFYKILETYDLDVTDQVHRKKPFLSEFSDEDEINTLVTNFLSSGTSLVNALELFVNSFVPSNESKNHTFKAFISHIYDNNYNYRLFYLLRNFTQHCHPAVSIYDNKFCFDLVSIFNFPQFNFNKSLESETRTYIEQVMHYHNVPLRYNFTNTIAEYTVCMAQIYSHFWDEVMPSLENSLIEFTTIATKKNAYSTGTAQLFYKKDEVIHSLLYTDYSLIFEDMRDQAKKFEKTESYELSIFQQTFKVVPIEDLAPPKA